MSAAKLITLVGVFFVTSIVSVVTGSTSLITVPVMIALGIEAHVAIATNMLALSFMSLGSSVPFVGKGILGRSRLPIVVPLTVVGSALGAMLLVAVPLKVLNITIAIAMIAVAGFSLLNSETGLRPTKPQYLEQRTLLATPRRFSWPSTVGFSVVVTSPC